MLKEMAQLIRLAKDAGVEDKDTDSIKLPDKYKDLFKENQVNNVTELGTKLGKWSNYIFMNEPETIQEEAQRKSRDILHEALMALDFSNLGERELIPNPIIERFGFENSGLSDDISDITSDQEHIPEESNKITDFFKRLLKRNHIN